MLSLLAVFSKVSQWKIDMQRRQSTPSLILVWGDGRRSDDYMFEGWSANLVLIAMVILPERNIYSRFLSFKNYRHPSFRTAKCMYTVPKEEEYSNKMKNIQGLRDHFQAKMDS